MAYDLILGKTRRDWSCGNLLSLPTATARKQMALDISAQTDSKKLGQLVRGEIQKNYDTIVRLDTTKRLPVVERKAFGNFMRKWVDFGSAHTTGNRPQPEFASEDVVALKNFREANRRFTERLAIFDQLARTPIRTPVTALASVTDASVTNASVTNANVSSPVPQFYPPGWQAPTSDRPWSWLLGLGLGLAGLGFLVRKNRP